MGKKIVAFFLCLCLLGSLAACDQQKTEGKEAPAQTPEAPVEKPKNTLGLQQDNPQNDALFNYGLACVKVGDKWGFINEKGEMVIEPQFDRQGKFYQGVFAVNQDGKYGFIDTTGQWVLEPMEGGATYFTEGYCVIRLFEKDAQGEIVSARMALLDDNGEICMELPEGAQCWPVRDGMLPVRTQDSLALYTPQGEIVFEEMGACLFEGDEATYEVFYDGLMTVEKDGKWGAINTKGEWVIQPQFDKMGWFENGVCKATVGDYYGYVDTTGAWVTEPQFIENYDDFSEGLVGAETDTQAGYIDNQGNWKIVLPKYEWVILGEFNQGVAAVGSDQGYGIMGKDGQWVLEPSYHYIGWFRCGVAPVETVWQSHGFINAEGQLITATDYRASEPFYDDGYGVAMRQDGKWVILDTEGNVAIDGAFDGVGNYETYWNDNGKPSVSAVAR